MNDELNALLCDYDKPDRAIAVRAAEILSEPYTDRENLAIRVARLESAREIAAQGVEGGDSDLIVHLRAAVSIGRPLLHSDVDEIAAALSKRNSTPHAADALDGERFLLLLRKWHDEMEELFSAHTDRGNAEGLMLSRCRNELIEAIAARAEAGDQT